MASFDSFVYRIMRRPLNVEDYGECLNWTLNGSINSLAFHFIATICKSPFKKLISRDPLSLSLSFVGPDNATKKTLEASIEAPATFFVQIFRLGLSLTFVVIILALYNRWGRVGAIYEYLSLLLSLSIDVLGRTIFSVASCSLHWVIFFILILIKYRIYNKLA